MISFEEADRELREKNCDICDYRYNGKTCISSDCPVLTERYACESMEKIGEVGNFPKFMLLVNMASQYGLEEIERMFKGKK